MGSLYYSTVVDVLDTQPRKVKCTWPEFLKKLRRPQVRGKYKLDQYLRLPRAERTRVKNGPGWIGGIFAKEGRSDETLDKLYFFVGDIDNKTSDQISFPELKSRLNGYEAAIHTTYSHSNQTPKFRFVIPLARPINRQRYNDLFNYFNNACGGALDPKGKTPSQLWFWPSCPPDAVKAFKFVRLSGKVFDPEKVSEKTQEATELRSVASENASRRSLISEDLPETLPIIKLDDLTLSPRIAELIRTGKDQQKRYASRSEMIFAVVLALVSRKHTDAQIAGILLDKQYGISEKVYEQKHPRKYVIRTIVKVRSMSFSGDPANIDEAIAAMNTKHAVINIGGRCFVLTEGHDPVLDRRDLSFGLPRDLQLMYANKRLVVNEKPTSIADIWLTHSERRQYERLVFMPQGDLPGCYNLWRGFSVVPKRGDCSLYLNHIRDNIASGDEAVYRHILAFMADAVQNPAKLPGITLVMRGGEGVGKGIFATAFGRLFGQHFIHVSNSRHLVGNFNAHLKDALVVFADEALYAGDKSAQGILNAIVTEALRVIEHKGKDVVTMPNYTRLVMASNHDWVVPAGPVARRFFVVDVSSERQQDKPYFTRILSQLANGGREALLDYLMNYDLTGVDLMAFPRTQALVDQQLRSLSLEARFWFDRLKSGELVTRSGVWSDRIKTTTLHDQFVIFAQKTGASRRSSQVELGQMIKKFCPAMTRKMKRTPEDYNQRSRYYFFPPRSECRAAFEAFLGSKIDWKS